MVDKVKEIADELKKRFNGKELEELAANLTKGKKKSKKMAELDEVIEKGYQEASQRAQEAGKGRIGQFRAGLKGAREKQEQLQIAKLGTTRKYANILGMFGIETGSFFNKYIEKKATKQQQEAAKKQFGMDEESLRKKKEEAEKKKAERISKKEGAAGGDRTVNRQIFKIKDLVSTLVKDLTDVKRKVDGISKVLLVKRGFKAEIDEKGKVVYRSTKQGSKGQYAKEEDASAVYSRVSMKRGEKDREAEAKVQKERSSALASKISADEDPQIRIADTLEAILKSLGQGDVSIHEKLNRISSGGSGGGLLDTAADIASLASLRRGGAIGKTVGKIGGKISTATKTLGRGVGALTRAGGAAASSIGAGAVVGAAGAVSATAATFYAFDQSVKQMASNAVDKLAKTSAKDIAIAFEKGYRSDWTRAQLYLRAEKDQNLKDKLHEADKIVVKDGYNLPGAPEEYTNKIKKEVEAEEKARFEAAAAPPAPVSPPTVAATSELSEFQVTAQKIATPELTEVQVTAQKIATPEPTEVQVTAQKISPSAVPKFKAPSDKPSMGKNGLLLPSENVADAIKNAANAVGVDRGIMLAMAKQESGFNPNAKAGTSSASGLFQFIDTTWNSMVQKYGKKFPDLLKGRFDLNASAIAGALFIKENIDVLKRNGIVINGTSIYASHFLGPGGALKLFSANPLTAAVNVLGEKVAAANKSIFYEKDGKTPRTIADVQQFLYNKVGKISEMYSAYAAGPSISPAATMVAQAPPPQTSLAASAITPAPSTTGSQMSAQSDNYATSQMIAQNQPPPEPVIINNSSGPVAAPIAPKQSLPKALSRNEDGSFLRALAKDFSHPTAFTTASMV